MSVLGARDRKGENFPPDARAMCATIFVAGFVAFWTVQFTVYSFIPEVYRMVLLIVSLAATPVGMFVDTAEPFGAAIEASAIVLVVTVMLVSAGLYIRWWMSQCDGLTARIGAGSSALRILVGVSTVYLATLWMYDARGLSGYTHLLVCWQYLLCAAAIVGGAILGWSRPDRFRSSVRTTYFTLWLVTWCCPIPWMPSMIG